MGFSVVIPTSASLNASVEGEAVLAAITGANATLTAVVGVPGPQGPAGEPGEGVPAGGDAGMVLAKVDGVDYNTEWINVDVSAKRDLTDYDFTNVADEKLTTFGLTLEPYTTLTGVYNSNIDAQALSLEVDNSDSGTAPGFDGYMHVNAGAIYNVTETWSLDGEGALVSDGGSGFWLRGSGLTFNSNAGNPSPSSIQYLRNQITFGNGSVQSIAFPGFNNAALTGNPTAPTAALGDNDTSIATTAFVQQELLSGTANAKNLEVYVRNQTGSTLAAGTIVYVNGATGNRPTVTPAQANNDSNSAQTIGFVKTSIANNGFGYVIVRGELENINTSALTEGVQLYLSPTTAGTWTTTKPSAPQHLVYVGIVIRAHPTQGVILVSVQNGYELNELHDVQITTPTNGQVLKYDSATNLWKNQTDSVGAVTSVAGRTGAVVLSNTDISGLGTMATATATDYLSKAGNLSGLASASTSRNNLELGAANNVTFNAVGRITGGNLSGETTRAYSLGINSDFGGNLTLSKYLYTDDGGDPAIVYVSDYKQADYTSSGIVIKNTTLDVSGVEQDGYRFRIGGEVNSGIYATRWTAGVPDGYSITPDQLLLNSAGNGYFSIEPATGITFPDATVQTTAAFNFDPTGYATESWVTSQGYLVSGDLTGYATESWVTSQGYLTSAPVTSVAGKTGAVTLAVADVSGAAPLASPTFTGTPSLPTGTTAVTQAAGNNTTAVATTAFVTSAVPAFATPAQARGFTSTTTTVSPRNQLWAMLSQDVWQVLSSSMAATNVGTITYVQAGQLTRVIRPGTAGACSSRIRIFGQSQVDQVGNFNTRTTPPNFNFSLRSIHSGRSSISGITQSQYSAAFYYGKAEGDGVGDLVRRGYGWKLVGGAGSRFLELQVHNGTTLTSVTSSYAVTSGVGFDWDIESDGAGNVTLYVNGNSVATSSAGPTGTSSVTAVVWQEEVIATSALTNSFSDFFNSRGKFAVLNP